MKNEELEQKFIEMTDWRSTIFRMTQMAPQNLLYFLLRTAGEEVEYFFWPLAGVYIGGPPFLHSWDFTEFFTTASTSTLEWSPIQVLTNHGPSCLTSVILRELPNWCFQLGFDVLTHGWRTAALIFDRKRRKWRNKKSLYHTSQKSKSHNHLSDLVI